MAAAVACSGRWSFGGSLVAFDGRIDAVVLPAFVLIFQDLVSLAELWCLVSEQEYHAALKGWSLHLLAGTLESNHH